MTDPLTFTEKDHFIASLCCARAQDSNLTNACLVLHTVPSMTHNEACGWTAGTPNHFYFSSHSE